MPSVVMVEESLVLLPLELDNKVDKSAGIVDVVFGVVRMDDVTRSAVV
jgi:hypothetical protein